MKAEYMIAVYVLLDEWHGVYGKAERYERKMSVVEVLWVAVMAAKYFENNQERALVLLCAAGYIPKQRWLSISRFNRQLHRQRDLLEAFLECLLEGERHAETFIIDSQPLPVCKRTRARRCRKVQGHLFYGYCAAKEEKYFGWKLHLLCTAAGVPANFTLLPAALHDLTPIYELTTDLPPHATVLGDKAYNSALDEAALAADALRLIPIRRRNMKLQHGWADEFDLRTIRPRIETLNSQSEAMGILRLRAHTNEGFFLKLHASLIALFCASTLF
jgi:hypothetical protein